MANTSVVTTLTKDGEYKPRANDNWGYAIDADGIFKDGGDNFKFEGETGEYKVVVDVNKHPFVVKVLSRHSRRKNSFIFRVIIKIGARSGSGFAYK